MTGISINVGVIIKNVLKRARVKKGQNFGLGGLLTRFLHGHDIEKEEADYRPTFDPMGIDVTKTKEPRGINDPVLSINEHNARIDIMLNHLYALCRVCPRFEDPLDNDVATKDEMVRVDLDIESSDDNEEGSEMGESALAPKDNEE
ncbi:hypothetical protein HAX54_006158 [Datura stramonium]|uniref:Uncharacterized protein n=1 Tax=Datura stramonium TaxID=4076 RepID=A0ABS8WYR1_DATST|nr:hypothetical protein [Datura stramonium]